MSDDPKRKLPRDDLHVDFGEVIHDPGFMARVDKEMRESEARREEQMRERERQARADALASFEVWFDNPRVWSCPYCKALVTGREQHLDWHGALAATAAQASHADMFSRPIG